MHHHRIIHRIIHGIHTIIHTHGNPILYGTIPFQIHAYLLQVCSIGGNNYLNHNTPTTNVLDVRPCLPVANPHSFLPSVYHSTDCLGPISLFSITRTVSFLIVILSLSPWLHTRAQPLHLNPNNNGKARPTELFIRRATCDMRRHSDPTLPCRPRYRARFRPTSPI